MVLFLCENRISEKLLAPFVLIDSAKIPVAARPGHHVKGLPHFVIFSTEENPAQAMTIGGKELTCALRHRQQGGTRQPSRHFAIVRTAVEAPDPGFCPSNNLPFTRPGHHFPSRIKVGDFREPLCRFLCLIGNEANPESSFLPIKPLMKAAAHPAASIVVNFDPIEVEWELHIPVCIVFSVFTERSF
jgi:hypothetical protein